MTIKLISFANEFEVSRETDPKRINSKEKFLCLESKPCYRNYHTNYVHAPQTQ